MTARADDAGHDTARRKPAGPEAVSPEALSPETVGARRLRRDAERNRQRVLAAAAEVFTQRGLEATLDDVARAAGVGVGTVYRRFPDKESLVAELFRDQIDALVAVAEEACAATDPWQGLVSYLEFATGSMAGDLGLRQLMMYASYGREQVAYASARMRPVISRLVERAQAAGQLRQDFRATDVKLIVFMLASAAAYACQVQPDVWRRYLTLVLDGMRPHREGTSELPVPALSIEQMEDSMRAHVHRHKPFSRAFSQNVLHVHLTGPTRTDHCVQLTYAIGQLHVHAHGSSWIAQRACAFASKNGRAVFWLGPAIHMLSWAFTIECEYFSIEVASPSGRPIG